MAHYGHLGGDGGEKDGEAEYNLESSEQRSGEGCQERQKIR